MSLKTSDPNHYAYIYNESDKELNNIRILDSTLREGEQHPGVSVSKNSEFKLHGCLIPLVSNQIEISPVVSPDHFVSTKTIIKQGLKADILAHVRAMKSDIDVAISYNAE